MPIGSAIAAIEATKTAIGVAKAVAASGTALETADLKLKMLEVVEALSDAKEALIDARDELRAKDAEIERLKSAFDKQGEVVRCNSAMYDVGPDGRPTGAPYCLRCWEADRKLFHLAVPMLMNKDCVCHHCGSKFDHGSAYVLE